MPLPTVDRERIQDALAKFDSELRATVAWQAWESSAAQRFALAHEGQRYPPKKIISLATGVPVSQFSGGSQSNSYLTNLGFEIVPLERSAGVPPRPQFQIGRVYDRWPEINDPFGGGRQGGISASRQSPAIFLFTGESGELYGYKDHFDQDGVFTYTGEGQVGDMELNKGNRAIVDHAQDGRALHVFETLSRPRAGQRYLGEFTYASHEFRRGPDRNGADRRIIVFHLIPVELVPDDPPIRDEPVAPKESVGLAEARRRALAALGGVEQSGSAQARRTLYKRSQAVKDYVLLRANGRCESCKEPAPFARVDGTPYLEPHHTTRVSDGGLDHPTHVAAICPTCHREIHYGRDGDDRNAELIEYLVAIEPAG